MDFDFAIPTDADFPEGYEDFTEAEKGAWYNKWQASRRGGGGGPDLIMVRTTRLLMPYLLLLMPLLNQ